MESAVPAIIHSDRSGNRVPKTGEMVRVEGRKGLFRVNRVDRQQKTVELMQRAWNREVMELCVTFDLIRAVPRQASKAIQQFLGPNHPRSRSVPVVAVDPSVLN